MIAPRTPNQPHLLHLVAPPSTRQTTKPQPGRTIPCLLLANALNTPQLSPSNANTVYIIGDSSTKATATQLGLNFDQHISPILSTPKSAKRKAITHIKQSTTSTPHDTPPSKIVCWSDELIHLASSVASTLDIPAELVSTNPTSIKAPPHNIDTIRVAESTDLDTWQSHRRTCQTDQSLAQLLSPTATTPEHRSSSRARLDIDDHTIVIGAIADNPADVDAREFAFLLGLLAVSGYQTLGILPNTAKNLNQALRHHRGLGQPFRILTTTDPLPKLLPILDAYIHPTDEFSGSTKLLDAYLEHADIPKLNLRHSGKAGFSRAQGTAGQLLDEMDQIVNTMQSRLTPTHT